MEDKALAARLKALRPNIEAILTASGCAGASIGIARAGKVVHVEGFGYRDVERKTSTRRRHDLLPRKSEQDVHGIDGGQAARKRAN